MMKNICAMLESVFFWMDSNSMVMFLVNLHKEAPVGSLSEIEQL